MTKTKILYSIIGLLVVLNTCILVVGLINHQPRPDDFRPENPKDIIVSRLNLDAEQQIQFEKSMHEHQAKIEKLDDSIRSIRTQLYHLLPNRTPDLARKKELIAQYMGIQAQVEETHWQHFIEIKQLCHPNQLADFARLTNDISQLFSKRGHPPHPPRNE